MDQGRRERIWNDIELLSCVRKRIKGIRDDEDHARRGSAAHGYGSQEACRSGWRVRRRSGTSGYLSVPSVTSVRQAFQKIVTRRRQDMPR